MTSPLHDTDEAATYLHLQPSTLETWRSARCGPVYVKVGRRVFYRLEDLDRWLASRAVEPANDKRRPKAPPEADRDPSRPNVPPAADDGERREA